MIHIAITPAHLEAFNFGLLGVRPGVTPSPQGIWFGVIDGWASTAPCGSPTDALDEARHIFLCGHYRRRVAARIQNLGGLVVFGSEDQARAQFLLEDAIHRMEKIDAWLTSMALSHGL